MGDNGPTNINAPNTGTNDTINIRSTGGLTTVNTSEGATSTINVGSLSPSAGGMVNGLQGTLAVVDGESSSDTLNVDDTGSTGAKSGTLTATTLTGLGMGAGGITYDSYYTLAGLNIALGSGHDTLRIASTSSSTTRVNGGVFGSDTFNVQATTGALYLTGAALGNNVFNLGSTAPSSGGSVKNIAGPVFITGGTSVLRLITLAADGSNTINVDDSGDSANNSGDLTSSAVTGLGMGSGVTFVSVNAVNVTLGPGNISFDAQGANSRTVITVSAGTGTNNAVLSFSAGFYGDLTLVNFATATLNVVGNFSGQFYDAAAVTAVTMAGSLTSNGLLEVGSMAP